ncbi:YD repeat-containing protein [Lysobacter niastensis]|uniref:YD repeat-containing protein n=1 Tax=Lysobacter niastensis TaxID=380629 RepID=A0ABU1WEY7_9GAMM|nr:DUF6531 domain-containing protein [Lysobacter niastensis]MDR7136160.1 YD repeat-containing protein [Lysobacter niastensis]
MLSTVRFVLASAVFYAATFLFPGNAHAAPGCYQDPYNLTYYCDTIENAYAAILADGRNMSPWCPPNRPPQYAIFKDQHIFAKQFGCGYQPSRESWGAAQSIWSTGCAPNAAWSEAAGRCLAQTDAKPEKNAGPTCCSFGDPINPATGNKYEVRQEYVGNGAFPLEFSWTYNSIRLNEQSWVNFVPQQYMLGGNRRHNYSQSVKIQNVSGVPAVAYVSRPEGTLERYTRSQSTWVAEPDNAAKFEDLLDQQGARVGWTRRAPNGLVESFNNAGRLIQKADRSGATQALSYDSSDRLGTVVDSAGRSLKFTYNASSQLMAIDLPDGHSLQFLYDSTDPAIANLTSVQYPDGSVVRYRYGEAGYVVGTGQPNALTGVIDESGARYSSTYYNASHQATGTELASGTDKYSAVYTVAPSSTYAASTAVTGPIGQQDVGEYTVIQGVARRTSLTSTCSGCATRHSSSTFDALGRVDVALDPAGSAVDYDYDAEGRLIKQVEAVNN